MHTQPFQPVRERKSSWPMVSVDDALCMVLEQARPLGAVKVPLGEATGYVLAETVVATAPQPAFPASIIDGYAAVASDGPGTYRVVGRITAGVSPEKQRIAVTSGTVAYITAGSKLPPGADAVVKLEDTEDASEAGQQWETEVRILPSGRVASGQWIRPVGSDVRKGETLVRKGTVMGPAEIGLVASVGRGSVLVYRAPVVGVMSTGDELVDGGGSEDCIACPCINRAACICDSNRPMLSAFCKQLLGDRARMVDLGIERDIAGRAALASAIEKGLQRCDVLITSGGVSMGEDDLLQPALLEMGATIHFGRLNMEPGKSTTFATLETTAGSTGRKKLIFALPGSPVSSLVSSHILVGPALRRLKGLAPAASLPPQVPVTLAAPTQLDPGRPEYQRVMVAWDESEQGFVGHTAGGQVSSRLLSMREANGLLCLPPGNETLKPGARVPCLLMGPLPPPSARLPTHAFPKVAVLEEGMKSTEFAVAAEAPALVATTDIGVETFSCCGPRSTSTRRCGT